MSLHGAGLLAHTVARCFLAVPFPVLIPHPFFIFCAWSHVQVHTGNLVFEAHDLHVQCRAELTCTLACYYPLRSFIAHAVGPSASADDVGAACVYLAAHALGLGGNRLSWRELGSVLVQLGDALPPEGPYVPPGPWRRRTSHSPRPGGDGALGEMGGLPGLPVAGVAPLVPVSMSPGRQNGVRYSQAVNGLPLASPEALQPRGVVPRGEGAVVYPPGTAQLLTMGAHGSPVPAAGGGGGAGMQPQQQQHPAGTGYAVTSPSRPGTAPTYAVQHPTTVQYNNSGASGYVMEPGGYAVAASYQQGPPAGVQMLHTGNSVQPQPSPQQQYSVQQQYYTQQQYNHIGSTPPGVLVAQAAAERDAEAGHLMQVRCVDHFHASLPL